MARPSKYPKELMDRGVRLALEGDRPIAHIANDRVFSSSGGEGRAAWPGEQGLRG